MTTATWLAGLLIPFALVVFGVLTVIRTTEDDEYTQRLADRRAADTEHLAPSFAAWQAECDADTEAALTIREDPT